MGDGKKGQRERERATLSRFIDFSHRKGEKSGEWESAREGKAQKSGRGRARQENKGKTCLGVTAIHN